MGGVLCIGGALRVNLIWQLGGFTFWRKYTIYGFTCTSIPFRGITFCGFQPLYNIFIYIVP
eukprot:c34942_g1_i1 orf=3-182(-)